MGLLDFTTQQQGGGGLGALGGLAAGGLLGGGMSDGFFGNGPNDPRSAAVLQLAAGLMAGRPSEGVTGYAKAMSDGQDSLLRRQLLLLQAAQAQQKFNMTRDAYYGSDGTGGGGAAPVNQSPPVSAPGIPGSLGGPGMQGPGQAAGTPPQAAPQNSLAAQLELIRRRALVELPGQKEALDILKYQNEPQKFEPGGVYVDRLTGQIRAIPQVSTNGQATQLVPDSTAPGGFRVIAPQGAIEVYGNYKNADKQVENANTLLPSNYVDQGTGRPIGGTIGAYLQNQPLANQGGGKLTPELQAAIRADAQRNGGPEPQVRLSAPGVRNPTFGLGAPSAPDATSPQASGQLQSAAEAEAAKAAALAPIEVKKAAEVGAVTDFNAYRSQLNKEVDTGYQQYLRNQQIRQLVKDYQTGLSAPDARTAFASNLVNAFPGNSAAQALAKKVNGGDVGNAQELANLLSSAGLTNVIRTLDGNGRVNKAEYQALQEHAESNRTDPSALEGIMAFQDNLYKQQLAEQKAMADAKRSGTLDPQTWREDYAQLRHNGATVPPTPAQAARASAPPTPMKGMIRGGYKFIGGDPASPSSWEKQ